MTNYRKIYKLDSSCFIKDKYSFISPWSSEKKMYNA